MSKQSETVEYLVDEIKQHLSGRAFAWPVSPKGASRNDIVKAMVIAETILNTEHDIWFGWTVSVEVRPRMFVCKGVKEST